MNKLLTKEEQALELFEDASEVLDSMSYKSAPSGEFAAYNVDIIAQEALVDGMLEILVVLELLDLEK